MCNTVKTPTPRPVEEKDPIYMRNPWLDGLGIGAEARGRNSLRIDLDGRVRGPRMSTPTPPGVYGGGGGGGGRGFTGGGGGGSPGLTIGRNVIP